MNPSIEAIVPCGDSALLLVLGAKADKATTDKATTDKVARITQVLRTHPFPGWIECVPAYVSIMIHYDPLQVYAQCPPGVTPLTQIRRWIDDALARGEAAQAPVNRQVQIPVCYDQDFAPDLSGLAQAHGISEAEVVARHTGRDYWVAMIGFLPGFAYLGGLDPVLATPRHRQPRLQVPAGSVGIAGEQTGIYSLASPGGWQIIGRTPVAMFSPGEKIPGRLQPGDQVRFYAIDRKTFLTWGEGHR
ncbi:5-oxoprolinase subunit PxpB [Heliophilum fasciatum]|uniref:Inhibitor of KinA n=1 Tax=Heliophilum fasciatum TaxID=35700 RepID=A0A4R2RMF7_9FIRM|nr:5-oxoprolinase subunit PxpB [Heliophilum fasciatum]MCW2277537.1 inhibitor of KinA [Heliophilum fasciatum]TCP65172.1 inhibitor of KinA [Heliophilum fasciatum]